MSDEDLERRLDAAGAAVRAALDAPPPDFRRVHRSAVRRRLVAGTLVGAVVAVIVAVATVPARDVQRSKIVAGPADTTTTTTMPSPPPTAGASLRSPVKPVRNLPTMLVGYPPADGRASRIDILEWASEWGTAASYEVPGPGVARDKRERVVLVSDVTGDGESDFLVPLEAASALPFTVFSNHGGSWQHVPFGSPERLVITLSDAPTAAALVTSTNTCEPTCSTGSYRRELWRYSASAARFVVEHSAVCEAIDGRRWRCDPPDSPLATGRPLAER